MQAGRGTVVVALMALSALVGAAITLNGRTALTLVERQLHQGSPLPSYCLSGDSSSQVVSFVKVPGTAMKCFRSASDAARVLHIDPIFLNTAEAGSASGSGRKCSVIVHATEDPELPPTVTFQGSGCEASGRTTSIAAH